MGSKIIWPIKAIVNESWDDEEEGNSTGGTNSMPCGGDQTPPSNVSFGFALDGTLPSQHAWPCYRRFA